MEGDTLLLDLWHVECILRGKTFPWALTNFQMVSIKRQRSGDKLGRDK